MKKIISILCLISLFSFSSISFADTDDIEYTSEGGYITVVNEYGLRMYHDDYANHEYYPSKDGATHTAIITQGEKTVYITIGKDTLQSGSKTIQMDTAAEIKDERTYIPIRFVGEALGMTVNWVNY